MPTSTAYPSIWATSPAVPADTTLLVRPAGVGTRRPSGLIVARTSRGSTHTPPLAIVAYTSAICRGVTAIPWPIGMVPMLVPDHCDTGGRIPRDSPGKSRPVGSSSPNRYRKEAKRVGPSMWATVMAPTLLE